MYTSFSLCFPLYRVYFWYFFTWVSPSPRPLNTDGVFFRGVSVTTTMGWDGDSRLLQATWLSFEYWHEYCGDIPALRVTWILRSDANVTVLRFFLLYPHFTAFLRDWASDITVAFIDYYDVIKNTEHKRIVSKMDIPFFAEARLFYRMT